MSLVMTAASSEVAVGSTAVQLCAFDATRVQVVVGSNGAAKIGGSNVSSTNGFSLLSGETVSIPTTGAQAELWAVGTSGVTVSVLEFKVL